ncbi:MAG TPA: cellulose binding domain-containing protein [Pseudobacteroides sp.]|uniref:anti-sigma-I factor RsgI family protein n=1 Tax=Pseudobacteroides sp. TaxID=1968840 RepID=UPI002F934225
MKHSGTIGYNTENPIDSADTESYDIGIVYEIFDYDVIVLDSKGQFVFLHRRNDMKIGHTVKYRLSDVLPRSTARFPKLFPFLSAAAAVLITVLVLFKLISPFGAEAYGYIDIDVNPSTGFEFDKDLEVINIVTHNSDSSKLINELDLCGKPLNEALGEYVEKLITESIINKKADNFVLFSAALNNNEDKKVVDSILSDSSKKVNSIAKSRKLKIISQVLSLTPKDKKASSENKMSMGKYYLYLKARENGSPLNKDSLKDMPVYRLAQLAGLVKTGNNSSANSTNNENIKSSAQPTNKTATAKPVAAVTPASDLKASPPAQKETNSLHTNTPILKDTELQNKAAPTPTKSQNTGVSPAPSKISPTKDNTSKDGTNRLKLEFYNRDKLKRTQGISLDIKITNTGSGEIDLKNLKVRYYFTKEGNSNPIYSSYFYSHGEESLVHGKFVSKPAKEGTEHYLELTFDSGTLLPGKEVYAFGSITKDDWGYFDQENDYSFEGEHNIFEVWDSITAYISDTLVWGKEPY